jgi:hypothetical protein
VVETGVRLAVKRSVRQKPEPPLRGKERVFTTRYFRLSTAQTLADGTDAKDQCLTVFGCRLGAAEDSPVPIRQDVRPNPAYLVLAAGLRGSLCCSAVSTLRSHLSEHATEPSFIRPLPYTHICGMGCLMKTTLNIDDTVMRELKREAARQGRTMSELVETALRLLLRSQRKRGRIPALPTFRSGGTLVDVADRDALYHAMEGR